MQRTSLSFLSASLFFGALTACEPKLVVGKWSCKDAGAALPDRPNVPIELPWTTGFERGFCDYESSLGYCYPSETFEIVTSPVHSGRAAASFHIISNKGAVHQSRCVTQGVFPKEGYYSAWYFIPKPAVSAGNWNLFYFQAGDANTMDTLEGQWDVSLHDAPNGDLSLFVRLQGTSIGLGETPVVPIGAWFQLEVYFRRAMDATGELTVYQDGESIISASGVITDKWNWGQWYVGNLADGLTPPDSTLYVDDVAIRETR